MSKEFFGRWFRNPRAEQINNNSSQFDRDENRKQRDPGDWCAFEQATLITSKLDAEGRYHAPAIDIDFPCTLLPSSTPGKFHLYIDYILNKDDYFKLLDVMAEIGVVEEGFVGASKSRGYSSLRMPGVKKTASASF